MCQLFRVGKIKKKNNWLAKIASFTTSSLSSALTNYKKKKEQEKIKAIKLQKLEERNSYQKEKKGDFKGAIKDISFALKNKNLDCFLFYERGKLFFKIKNYALIIIKNI